MVNMEVARTIVLANLQEGTNITAAIEYEDAFMFIAIRPDENEGRFDPFFKVNKVTGAFIDFSPQDYDNPLEIINLLVAQTK